ICLRATVADLWCPTLTPALSRRTLCINRLAFACDLAPATVEAADAGGVHQQLGADPPPHPPGPPHPGRQRGQPAPEGGQVSEPPLDPVPQRVQRRAERVDAGRRLEQLDRPPP